MTWKPRYIRSKSAMIRKMQSILKKQKMSKDLRRAIQATVTALKRDDVKLAADLSAVKSFIATKMKGKKLAKRHHFYEYEGSKIYEPMDWIHHELASKAGQIPSGMSIVTVTGILERGKPKRRHPILTLMQRERAAIQREATRRAKKWKHLL